MRPYVMYTPCATSLRGKPDNIITFTQFEEGNSPSEKNHHPKLVTMQKSVNNPITIQ